MARRAGAPTVRRRPGSEVYTCRFTAHGVRYDDLSTGERDYERALAAARRMQAEALLHRPPQRRGRVRHADQASLAVLSALYLEHVESSGLSALYLKAQKKHFRAHFLKRWKRLSDLTTAAIERYPASRAAERTYKGKPPSTQTVYRELVTLSRFLRWCVRAGHLDAVPVFDRVRPVSHHKPVDLTREQVERVLAELPTRREHRKRYAVRERYTVQWAQGFRDGDVAALRWADVDLERGLVTIRQGDDKARMGRTVELAAASRAVLAEMARERHPSTALVFGRANPRVTLTAACKRAGVPRITTHGFRHARLTELASSTHDTAAIQYIAGHKHLATTDRYVRSRTERTGAVYAAADSGGSRASTPRKKPARRGAMKR